MTDYLISGIGPGSSGVGRLMRQLEPRACARGFHTCYRYEPVSLRDLWALRQYGGLAYGLLRRLWLRFRFWLVVRTLSGSRVLFLHPQTAGMDALFRLAARNRVFIYVMDSSFFCLRSYNTHPQTHRECLQCLPGPQHADPACLPFPIPEPRAEAVSALHRLRELAPRLVFLAQNTRQADLLRETFGEVEVHIVGMDTGEVGHKQAPGRHSAAGPVVYHAAALVAKGLGFFIELAQRLPTQDFVIPDSRDAVERELGRVVDVPNVRFQPCQWETGLSRLVQEAQVVVNPSVWSAPIEGALVKSFAFNGVVATVATRFGYEAEIAPLTRHLRLDENADVAAQQLSDYLKALACNDQQPFVGPCDRLFFPAGARNVLDVIQHSPDY